mmetsp:Transcript_174672/g.560171  ORF Transcript_174672/g.560171 Transcript_174672/m.560171 type:complete len:371 (+) Transcript_174672:874-1986(+)
MALVTVAAEQDLHVTCDFVARVDHQPVQGLADHVDALLHGEAADEGQHGDVGILLQADLRLQLQLARLLPLLEARHVILHRQESIVRWVPGDDVDAVEDPRQKKLLVLDEAFEAEASLHRLHLGSVARGHCQDPVASQDGTLRQVPDVAVVAVVGPFLGRVLVDQVLVRPGVIQAEVRDVHILDDHGQRAIRIVLQLVVGVDPLVTKVVHDEEAAGVGKSARGPHAVREVNRQQRCLPVVPDEGYSVAIADAADRQCDRRLQSGKAEQGKPVQVVRVLHTQLLVVVKATWAMEARVVNEDVIHTCGFAQLVVLVEVLDHVLAIEKPNLLVGQPRDVFVVVVHRANGHCPVPPLRQLNGQRGRNEREAATL